MQNVPLQAAIHIIGLGEEAPPPELEADLTALNPNPSKTELNRWARRVKIRVLRPGELNQAEVSRTQD